MVISIVTPSFNQGRFIEKTIKSVLDQKGDSFIDYFIADGGSTDKTVEIIKKYDVLLKNNQYPIKCKHITYHWRSRKDKGQAAAINEGFKKAKGEIFAWINSDDYYRPGTFQRIAKEFDKDKNLGFVYGQAKLINQSSSFIELPRRSTGSYNDLREENFIRQSSTFFTKKLFNTFGPFDETLHNTFDYDFWLKVFSKCNALYIPEILSTYVLWDGCKTSVHRDVTRREWEILNKRYKLRVVSLPIFYNSKTVFFFDVIKKFFPKFYVTSKEIFLKASRKSLPK